MKPAELSALLCDVLPAFIEALPSKPTPYHSVNQVPLVPTQLDAFRHEAQLMNAISSLRSHIQQMRMTLAKYSLACEISTEACAATKDILILFDGLVKKEILEDEHTSVSTNPDESLSRLSALRRRVLGSTRSQSLRLVEGKPSGDLATSNSSMISYGDDANNHMSIGNEVGRFNKLMEAWCRSRTGESESGMAEMFGQQDISQESQTAEDDQQAMKEIHEARHLCEKTKAIFRLVTEMCCQPHHSAHVHLSGFELPEIDMFISHCGGQHEQQLWHQVCWDTKQPSISGPPLDPDGTVCSILRRHRKVKTEIRVHVQGNNSWTYVRSGRIKKHATPPETALEELLNLEQDRRGHSVNLRILPNRDKLILAHSISRSLLFLVGSPFLRDPLKTQSVHVAQVIDDSIGSQSRTKAYIGRELIKMMAEDAPGEVLALSSHVLHLGVLLWEMFLGSKVTPTEVDLDDTTQEGEASDLTLFYALGRQRDFAEKYQFQEPLPLKVVSNCLDLFSDYSLNSPELWNEEKFRGDVYWKIVKPLYGYGKSFLSGTQSPSKSQSSSTVRPCLETLLEQSPSSGRPCSFRGAAPLSALRKDSHPPSEISLPIVQASPGSQLLASNGIITDSSSWLRHFDSVINDHLKSIARMDSRSVTPVKVAVLDTGCDMDAFCFTSSGSGQDERLEGRWLDFVGKEKNPVDEDLRKHGTAMTTLLMRLLPISTAEIYVARVARDSKGLLGAQDNIANAITHACQTWKVDVVSMSFGFPNDTTDTSKIQRAMSDAENSRDCKVLFFAAANNDGLHEPEMFPASSESVISVRGTDHSGGFITRYNPTTWPHKRGNLYGTLSENVPCDWDCGRSIQSGCSVATPIVAAIAANMICFVSNRSIELEVREVDLMRTRKGILSVFDVFTTNQQDRTGIQRYLAPHRLLNRDDMKSTIPYALSRSRVPSGG